MKYPLVKDTIRDSDIDSLCEWLKTYPRLSKGPLTPVFEDKWSKWLGSKYSVYVNSGSSANLLILSALVETGRISRDAKVVVPAVSWATDLAPVMQLGLSPVLCDCNMEDLSIDLEQFEKVCQVERPQAIIFVSVLGLVPDMERLTSICERYGVILIEDTCESFGSEYQGKKLGTFGLASTFSLYFGHHLSTIEGGIVSTDDTDLYNALLSIRSHGWMRDCESEYALKKHKEWQTEEFNSCYTFYYPGFNLRSTDLQAHIGIRQMDYADTVNRTREQNFRYYLQSISDEIWKPMYREGCFVSNFCYPLVVDNRQTVCDHLERNGIETRPLIAGSMSSQPFYVQRYGESLMPNADRVHKNGLYIPNNHAMTPQQVGFISSVVNRSIQ